MQHLCSKRVRFSVQEVDFLKEAYQKSSTVSSLEAKSLAESLGCEKNRVDNWFAHRRAKDRATRSHQHFTDHQKEQLEIAYQKSSMPTKHALKQIAKRLDITEVKRVVSWFSRKRLSEHVLNIEILDQEQTEYLMSIYAKTKYPQREKMNKIAKTLGTTAEQIYAWFTKERAKTKKEGVILRKKNPPPKCPDFNTTTTKLLEAAFEENPQPTNQELKKIMKNTKIDERRIKTWFDSKRLSVRSLALIEKVNQEKNRQNTLEEAYQSNKYLSVKEVNELGDRIGMQHLRVQSWIRYHRRHDQEFDKDNVILPKRKKIDADAQCILNAAYQENKNLTSKEMYALADRVDLNQRQVSEWFHRTRSKDKDYESKARYTAAQTQSLQAAYQKNPRPSIKAKEKLAVKTGLSLKQINNWFKKIRGKSEATDLLQESDLHDIKIETEMKYVDMGLGDEK